MVTHPRQIADHERAGLVHAGVFGAGQATSHGRRVMGHVLGGDLKGVLVAEHDHGQGVADENHVGPGAMGDPGTGRVVRGDHDQAGAGAVAVALAGLHARGGHAAGTGGRGRGGRGAHEGTLPFSPSSAKVAAGGLEERNQCHH